MKRNMCKRCCVLLIPGVTAIVRTRSELDPFKGDWVHLEGKQLCHFYFCLPSQYGSTLKERICSLWEQILCFRSRHLLEGLHRPGKHTGSHKSCPP